MRVIISSFILFSLCASTLCYGNVEKAVDDDALLTVPQLIKKYKYPVEVHHVVTDDGYILEMHRIPHGVAPGAGPKENKPIVFVQHGLLSSSADWVIAGPKKSIAYLLADLGYDVWMGNTRGNTYSKNHTSLNTASTKFWDFSWHEMGITDIPNMIDYTLNVTKQKQVYYIGHSQGTTVFFVMCSMRPEYNAKIKAMYALAPIAYMYHLTSPLLKFISFFRGPIAVLLRLLGINEFLPSSSLLAFIGDLFCGKDSLTQMICSNVLFILCGFSLEEMNTELLPVIMGHTPAGASTKQFLHYGQNMRALNKFRLYDYGPVQNILKYKSIFPPSYDTSKITAPIALFYSKNDWLAAEVDVNRLYGELKNKIGKCLVTDKYFNHLDFLWGKYVDTVVYEKLFKVMKQGNFNDVECISN